MRHGGRIRTGALLSGVAAAVVLLAGCGGGKNFADKPRPAAPVQLSGVIADSGVTVSPNTVGAGPIQILVANTTNATHTLELNGASVRIETGPIAPNDTGSIQRTLDPGTYTVTAGSTHAVSKPIKAARLVIGKPRPDSNSQLQLP